MRQICVSKHTIIGSDNSLPPGRHQAIVWTNTRRLLIWPLGTKFRAISIKIHISSFKHMHLKMSSAKCQPCCLSLNLLTPVLTPLPGRMFQVPWWPSVWVVPCVLASASYLPPPSGADRQNGKRWRTCTEDDSCWRWGSGSSRISPEDRYTRSATGQDEFAAVIYNIQCVWRHTYPWKYSSILKGTHGAPFTNMV